MVNLNFDLAPKPKIVDGLLAVPIDIQSLTAHFSFNVSLQKASADATMTYKVGPADGNPVFDLRQTITEAWLDGAPFAPAKIAHHNFGIEPFTDMRVIESVQTAGSVHTLRLKYDLSMPDSQLDGSYLPALEWIAATKLKFVFGLSDLNRARYVEAWLPANLVFDQFQINLEIEIANSTAAHSVITNGTATSLGFNHWTINFPARFTSLSPLLEIRASSTLVQQTDSVTLPVSGKTVSIEVWKPSTSSVDLTLQITNIKMLLTDYENRYGPYLHDERFVAFFNGSGGMEYDGATTTSPGALSHETFHSWFARGVKPASQSDGWLDEGLAVFSDDGADDAVQLDFSSPPVVLCSRDRWQRHTPTSCYDDGSRFWKGVASILGVDRFNSLMSDFYCKQRGNPISTEMSEEFLIAKSGVSEVVDAFHRFVYGFADQSPPPELWMKRDFTDSGADDWNGAFWDSPDLWIRNNNDDGINHQQPEYGQDNWFYARIRNKENAGNCKHFVVTFHTKGYAGTEFVYPLDFFPCIAAKAEFDLAPGETRIVKARWPRKLVPPKKSHTCLLVSVIARGDPIPAYRHVWEHNNLAQKNLTVVDLVADSFIIIPVVISNFYRQLGNKFKLAIWREEEAKDIPAVSLIVKEKELVKFAGNKLTRFKPNPVKKRALPRLRRLECGGYVPTIVSSNKGQFIGSDTPELLVSHFSRSWEVLFPSDETGIIVDIPSLTRKIVGLKIALPSNVKTKLRSMKLQFVQSNAENGKLVGGIAVVVNPVKKPNGERMDNRG